MSGLWYENVADGFEPESRLSMGLKEKPQMLDCQDYQITRVPPLSMLVNRLSKAPETSLMILYYVVKISVFFTFVMYRNLKFLHMTDFFCTDTVLVSVTNIRYDEMERKHKILYLVLSR